MNVLSKDIGKVKQPHNLKEGGEQRCFSGLEWGLRTFEVHEATVIKLRIGFMMWAWRFEMKVGKILQSAKIFLTVYYLISFRT